MTQISTVMRTLYGGELSIIKINVEVQILANVCFSGFLTSSKKFLKV